MRTVVFTIALSLSVLFQASAQARDVTEGVDTEQGGTSSSRVTSHEKSGSGSGAGGTAQTCTESCNRDYDGCMDQQSAVPGNGDTLRYSNNFADKLIGTSSDCSDHLRTCLNGCGG